jgi:hypothetical protein
MRWHLAIVWRTALPGTQFWRRAASSPGRRLNPTDAGALLDPVHESRRSGIGRGQSSDGSRAVSSKDHLFRRRALVIVFWVAAVLMSALVWSGISLSQVLSLLR